MLSLLLIFYIVLSGFVTMALISAVIMSGLTNSAERTESGATGMGGEKISDDSVSELPAAPCESHCSELSDLPISETEELLTEVDSTYKRVHVF